MLLSPPNDDRCSHVNRACPSTPPRRHLQHAPTAPARSLHPHRTRLTRPTVSILCTPTINAPLDTVFRSGRTAQPLAMTDKGSQAESAAPPLKPEHTHTQQRFALSFSGNTHWRSIVYARKAARASLVCSSLSSSSLPIQPILPNYDRKAAFHQLNQNSDTDTAPTVHNQACKLNSLNHHTSDTMQFTKSLRPCSRRTLHRDP